ncbi:MAG: CapA family protein [Coriobacteriales bacterium]|jgi:poly-gamma-glutamate synthesis protein (capsule biosynthesis protein)|nr:CapA family protein [Coriobacteriales bacterium]
MHHLIKAVLRLFWVLTAGRVRSSRQVEGNAATMNTPEKLWWAYKFYIQPATEPQSGHNIRAYFAEHRFDEGWQQQQEGGSEQNPPLSPTLTLALAGDILPSPNLHTGSATHFFDEIADFYLSADLRYANLESPVVADQPVCWPGENIISPPRMNNSPEVFELIHRQGRGVNVFSTANNHALDQGVEGLMTTLDYLDSQNVVYVGTSRSVAERDDIPVTEVNGVRVAWLSYTFSLNREKLPEGREYLVNLLPLNLPDCDITPIIEQVRHAREQKGAHVVVACLHWSLEYESFPLASLMQLGHRIVEAGVDIIAGNHPHGLQPAERYTYTTPTGQVRSGLITYALGDLVSDTPQLNFSALTGVCRIGLTRFADSDDVTISSVEFKPLYAYRRYDEQGRCTDLRLLDFRRLQQGITENQYSLLLDSRQKKEVRRLTRVLDDLDRRGDGATVPHDDTFPM